MVINAYSSNDDGVPSYSFATNAADITHFNSFKTIAKACLVTGYGAKAAAGWELVAEGAEYLVLRNGSRSGYVSFEYTSGNISIWLAQTFIEMSGKRLVGDGLKSGTATGNSSPHAKSIRYLSAYPASHCWSVLADERTAIFNFSAGPSTDLELTGTAGLNLSASGLLYVGEDSRGNFVSCGGGTDNGTAGRFTAAAGFTALRDPATGLLIDSGAISAFTTPHYDGTGGKSASFYGVLSTVTLSAVEWGCNGVWSQFRGVCRDARLDQLYLSAASRALGISSGLTFSTLITPLPLADNATYWFGGAAAGSLANTPNYIITDNPEFW